jgi:hypothetical protein
LPGGIPGPLGAAVFVGIKFGGYFLAAVALKKLQPTITASSLKIAIARTGLGVVIGPLFTIAAVWLASLFAPDESLYGVYAILFCVRILIWALVLFFFSKRTDLSGLRFWSFAFIGAVWSSLLDWPGYKLAIIAPGGISIC